AITDLMRTAVDGRGNINVLAADTLMQSPRLYATFLLWLLSELFDELPEIGDPEKPKLVFFFDEAHLLFNEAPKALLQKIEQVVRLIRSKGVGVYFVTQNPLDVPEIVLAQLGNRIQHALRAYTPRDQKAVKVAADTFRANPEFSTYDMITQLAVGEALVSTLEEKGVPSIVQKTLMRPPSSRIGTISAEERKKALATDPIGAMYDTVVDRESAYETLQGKDAPAPSASAPGSIKVEPGGIVVEPARREPARPPAEAPASSGGLGGILGSVLGSGTGTRNRLSPTQRVAREVTRSVAGRVAGQIAGDIGRQIGGSYGNTVTRAIVRGVLGSILRR
ncbi:MAG: helicase HerA-like domain-containing protein, partial [Bauldia sp.]